MKKSRWIATGSVLLAGLIMTMFVPKAAHAIAATAVQVMNTSAAPAITQDTSRQASQIVNLQCPNDSSSIAGFGCYVVPAGQNLVVTSMMVTPRTGCCSGLIRINAAGFPFKVEIVASTTVTTQYEWAHGLVFTSGQTLDLVLPGMTNVYLTGYLTAN